MDGRRNDALVYESRGMISYWFLLSFLWYCIVQLIVLCHIYHNCLVLLFVISDNIMLVVSCCRCENCPCAPLLTRAADVGSMLFQIIVVEAMRDTMWWWMPLAWSSAIARKANAWRCIVIAFDYRSIADRVAIALNAAILYVMFSYLLSS